MEEEKEFIQQTIETMIGDSKFLIGLGGLALDLGLGRGHSYLLSRSEVGLIEIMKAKQSSYQLKMARDFTQK